MAGEWIPMRMDLLDDPSVIAMSSALNLEEYAVVGRLLKLWSWANRHLKDGHAFVPDKWVDDYVGTPGFASAMLTAGWLRTRSSGGLEFTSFDRWNSQGAKIRLGETLRKRAFREKKTTPDKASNSPGYVPVLSRTIPPVCPGPEKRRVEKSKEQPTGGAAMPPAGSVGGALAVTNPPRPQKPPDSIHHAFVAAFCDSWFAKYGVSYPFVGQKDGSAVKWFRAQVGDDLDRFRAVVRNYLDDCTEFIVDARHAIGNLRSQWVRWAVDAAPGTGPPSKPKFETQDQRNMRIIREATSGGDNSERTLKAIG